MTAFKVGDRVYSSVLGKGTIIKQCPKYGTYVVDFDGEGKVEVVSEALTNVEYTPVSPSHYQVAGIPEAIEIMRGLMTKAQFEGFLWGNILKYAYRYGRKGDKKDTAGKIEWYAKQLEDIDADWREK